MPGGLRLWLRVARAGWSGGEGAFWEGTALEGAGTGVLCVDTPTGCRRVRCGQRALGSSWPRSLLTWLPHHKLLSAALPQLVTRGGP